ncbi:MAG: DUF47 family protein, partial [Promethearchaeota archaeon]
QINELIEDGKNKEKTIKVIQSEHALDKIKDEYIKVLYEEKRALPFLVEDRYRIIKYLDRISDESEDLAHLLRIYPFVFYEDIKEPLKNINDLCLDVMKELAELVSLMERDFKTAYQKTFYIENLKRKARNFKYHVLEDIYKKTDKTLMIYLTAKIIIKLYDMIVHAEEISDYLRSLIIKYPNK